ncbi:hypothetical protein DXG03_004847 [Asterophora parasitica]|uniref:UspA domain-containing protein n=1 Tax=Asterophora parasitica TaxID=117018 RepID=A0A9P7GJN9_9AGAR|nr:hypothetical protein DXG03_004847 [Asterophora parasitica]
MSSADGNRSEKKRSWTAKIIPRTSTGSPRLPTAEEGKELRSPSLPSSPATSTVSLPLGVPFTRSDSLSSLSTTPKRRSQILTATLQALDHEAAQLIHNGLERTASAQQSAATSSSTLKPPPEVHSRTSTGSFSKSFSSMMGSLSLSRTTTRDSTGPSGSSNGNDDKDSRGRSLSLQRKSISQPSADADLSDRSRSCARSTSPFTFRRFRQRDRDPSPPTEAIPLAQSDLDLSDSASSSVRPHTTAFSYDSGDETIGDETEDDDWSEDDFFDPVTERNTEANAIITPVPALAHVEAEAEVDPDPLGEGVNVVVPPEPYFPSTLNSTSRTGTRRNPRRRKSTKHHEPLAYETSRPMFQRDRATITITQGDPVGKLGDRRKRRYVVASDLSEESRYAVEWAIGTVLRDGDDLLIVTVIENDSKVDPPTPNAADRATKLRSQQERQGISYILVRQATSLLQRTKLNVKVACQAWHAKNARHMLLDIVDYNEPTMLIVGSRGIGQLKGILLGSTSHYLIQKCSVPVMVARRRLKRPPRRSAHLSTHRTHVSLAEAGIDRVAPKVDADVQVMRDAIKRDDDRRDGGPGSRDRGEGERQIEEDEDEDDDGEGEDSQQIQGKVAGT